MVCAECNYDRGEALGIRYADESSHEPLVADPERVIRHTAVRVSQRFPLEYLI